MKDFISIYTKQIAQSVMNKYPIHKGYIKQLNGYVIESDKPTYKIGYMNKCLLLRENEQAYFYGIVPEVKIAIEAIKDYSKKVETTPDELYEWEKQEEYRLYNSIRDYIIAEL